MLRRKNDDVGILSSELKQVRLRSINFNYFKYSALVFKFTIQFNNLKNNAKEGIFETK